MLQEIRLGRRAVDVIRVFIGYDPREAVAFSVLAHSIHVRATAPVSATPLRLSQLAGLFTRPRDPLQSTDFAFSRFLTPYLSGYEGWSLFMDCDMLVRDDIAKLWALRDDAFAVMVVKHDHRPREDVKFLGHAQTAYAKKNWSSVMLFNNARCRGLTPEYVNTASGLELHQFKWLDSDSLIGELPRRWNHLVGYDERRPACGDRPLHAWWTLLRRLRECEYADEWRAAFAEMLHASKPARLCPRLEHLRFAPSNESGGGPFAKESSRAIRRPAAASRYGGAAARGNAPAKQRRPRRRQGVRCSSRNRSRSRGRCPMPVGRHSVGAGTPTRGGGRAAADGQARIRSSGCTGAPRTRASSDRRSCRRREGFPPRRRFRARAPCGP